MIGKLSGWLNDIWVIEWSFWRLGEMVADWIADRMELVIGWMSDWVIGNLMIC